MNINEELLAVMHYEGLLETHGSNYRALDWGSEQGQQLRFSVLSQIGKFNGSSILDVGCGLGDLAGWMDTKGIVADYVGLDLTCSRIEEARRRYPKRKFIEGSITDPNILVDGSFDFVVASGIFYTYRKSGQEWLEQAVTRMWKLARHGVAFNSLSSWFPQGLGDEYNANPVDVINFCRTLTPWVRFCHDYHLNDFSIFLLREPMR